MKRYLFTPGPTPVPPEVLAAVGAPVLHHRSPDFLPVYERVLTRLREVCRTDRDVLLARTDLPLSEFRVLNVQVQDFTTNVIVVSPLFGSLPNPRGWNATSLIGLKVFQIHLTKRWSARMTLIRSFTCFCMITMITKSSHFARACPFFG